MVPKSGPKIHASPIDLTLGPTLGRLLGALLGEVLPRVVGPFALERLANVQKSRFKNCDI